MDRGHVISGHYAIQSKKIILKTNPIQTPKDNKGKDRLRTPQIIKSRQYKIVRNKVNKEHTPKIQTSNMKQMQQAIIDSKGTLKGRQKDMHFCLPNRMQFTIKGRNITLKLHQQSQTYRALASSHPLKKHQHHPMWNTLDPQPNWHKTPNCRQYPTHPKNLFDIRFRIMHNRLIIGGMIRHIPNLKPEKSKCPHCNIDNSIRHQFLECPMAQKAWKFAQNELDNFHRERPKLPQMQLNEATKLFGVTTKSKGRLQKTANTIMDIYSSCMLYSINRALQQYHMDIGKTSTELYIARFKSYIINATSTIAVKMRQDRKNKTVKDWTFLRIIIPKWIEDYEDATKHH